MTMMTVFDPNGVAHTVEAVDAREYLKSGHYTSEPPEVVAEEVDQGQAEFTPGSIGDAMPGEVEQANLDQSTVAPIDAQEPAVAPRKPGPKPKAK